MVDNFWKIWSVYEWSLPICLSLQSLHFITNILLREVCCINLIKCNHDWSVDKIMACFYYSVYQEIVIFAWVYVWPFMIWCLLIFFLQITGGSSGIGKALAIEAVKNGANVTIMARNEVICFEALCFYIQWISVQWISVKYLMIKAKLSWFW